jgi:hypothetical protein
VVDTDSRRRRRYITRTNDTRFSSRTCSHFFLTSLALFANGVTGYAEKDHYHLSFFFWSPLFHIQSSFRSHPARLIMIFLFFSHYAETGKSSIIGVRILHERLPRETLLKQKDLMADFIA